MQYFYDKQSYYYDIYIQYFAFSPSYKEVALGADLYDQTYYLSHSSKKISVINFRTLEVSHKQFLFFS